MGTVLTFHLRKFLTPLLSNGISHIQVSLQWPDLSYYIPGDVERHVFQAMN